MAAIPPAITLTPEQLQSNLYMAASAGKVDEVKSLIAQGVDVKTKDNQGYTALHWGAMNDNVESYTTLGRCAGRT